MQKCLHGKKRSFSDDQQTDEMLQHKPIWAIVIYSNKVGKQQGFTQNDSKPHKHIQIKSGTITKSKPKSDTTLRVKTKRP